MGRLPECSLGSDRPWDGWTRAISRASHRLSFQGPRGNASLGSGSRAGRKPYSSRISLSTTFPCRTEIALVGDGSFRRSSLVRNQQESRVTGSLERGHGAAARERVYELFPRAWQVFSFENVNPGIACLLERKNCRPRRSGWRPGCACLAGSQARDKFSDRTSGSSLCPPERPNRGENRGIRE